MIGWRVNLIGVEFGRLPWEGVLLPGACLILGWTPPTMPQLQRISAWLSAHP